MSSRDVPPANQSVDPNSRFPGGTSSSRLCVVVVMVLALVVTLIFGISFRSLVLLAADGHLVALVCVGATFATLLLALLFVAWMTIRQGPRPPFRGSTSVHDVDAEEDRFRQLADSMPQIVWAARPDGYLDYYNQRWYQFTGFPHGGGDESWLPILHPEDAQLCRDTWYEAVRTGHPYQIEYRFEDHRTGEYRWHLGRALPVRDAAGRIIRWYGTSTDIDVQKRAIVELGNIRHELEHRVGERTSELIAANETLRLEVDQRHEVERRLQLQYKAAQVLARSNTLPEAIVDVLEAIRETLGWDIVEFWQYDRAIAGVRCLAICPGPTPALEKFARESRLLVFDSRVGLPYQVWESKKATWIESLASDRPLLRMEMAQAAGLTSGLGFPVLSGHSVVGVLNFFGKQIPEPDADMIAVLAGIAGQIGQFIDRKLADAALREATDRLQAIHDAATEVAVIAATPEGVITLFNVGAERMLGYSAAEMVGLQTPNVFHCPDEVRRRAAALTLQVGYPVEGFAALVLEARLGRPEQGEWTYIRKDGTRLDVNLVVTAQRNSAGEVIGFLGIAKDISERKRAANALANAKEAAEAANRAKGDFLAIMSHEIRTPLNGILGMTTLLLDTEVSPTQREYLDSLEISAERLLSLINDILDLSKIDAGKLDLDTESFDLRGSLADTLRPLALEAHEKGLEIACRVAPGVPDPLLGDFGRLRQILLNLLGNAIKFTKQGEVVLDVRLEESNGDEVVLRCAVKDTGIGIAPEKLETIFAPFEQADGSTTRRYGGTGLGLTISARLVKLLRGSIHVESAPGRGSVFSFTVRMSVRAMPPHTVADDRLRGGRVLLIEDNATQRGLILEILGGCQMEPVAVGGADEALEALRRATPPFELILLDSTLPGDAALAFAHQVRQNTDQGRMPLILLTADGGEQQSRWADLGLEGTVPKPIYESQLLEVIASVRQHEDLPPASPQAEQREPEARPAAGSHLSSPPAPEVVATPIQEPAPTPLRILLAEDNKINQVVLTHTLQKEGYRVVVAENGREALDAVERETFDLVLMDVAMPVMDGLEATRLLRERERGTGSHLPVIALTANAMTGDREMCLAAGMDAYIGKPFQVADLRQTIRGVAGKEVAPPKPPESALAVLDEAGLLARLNGNRTLLKTLTQLFRVEGPRQLAAVRIALERGDPVAVERAAHMLKGAVALLASPRAAEAARHLEVMGKEGSLAGAGPTFARLEVAVHDLERALGALEGAG